MNYRHHPMVLLAARDLAVGKVVAYPTEAVWGLGCDPFNSHAVSRILELKRRDPAKGLILVASHISQFDFLLHDLPEALRAKMLATWPGPSTWLVPHQKRVPKCVSGRFSTVAIRVSAHPLVAALCDLFGGAIVSTSANPQGRLPARFGYSARRYFGDNVVYTCGQVDLGAKPSQIRDLLSGQIIRL